jgi:hypothetical protein
MTDAQFAAILDELTIMHRRKQEYRDLLDATDYHRDYAEFRRLEDITNWWVNQVHTVERTVEIIFGRETRDRVSNAAYDAVYQVA